jgi:hypothetical protein
MFGRTRQQLDAMQESLHKIESALVVRDPGTARSVEAYDGLRKQIGAAMRHRRQHLVQLTLMAEALDRGADNDSLRSMVAEWASQAGLRRWTDPTPLHFFETMGGEASSYEVAVPAWVDEQGEETILVKAGLLRGLPEAAGDLGAEVAVEDPVDTPDSVESVESGPSSPDVAAEQTSRATDGSPNGLPHGTNDEQEASR